MKTKLDYVSGATILPKNSFGISPSQLATFFSSPTQWYNEQVMKEKPAFQGSTSTYLGTIVHYYAEEFTKTGKIDKSEIYKYLCKELCSDLANLPDFNNFEECEEYLLENADKEGVDITTILEKFPIMAEELLNYLTKVGIPSHSEDLISANVQEGYYVAGSCDAYNSKTCTITDYKTTSMTTVKDSIPYNYKLQLLCYAYIYRKLGLKVDKIQIVWITQPDINRISEKTGNRLKDYPCKVVPVTYMVTEDDWNLIDNILNLVADTVRTSIEHPELLHVIWKDYRLKPKPKNVFLKE